MDVGVRGRWTVGTHGHGREPLWTYVRVRTRGHVRGHLVGKLAVIQFQLCCSFLSPIRPIQPTPNRWQTNHRGGAGKVLGHRALVRARSEGGRLDCGSVSPRAAARALPREAVRGRPRLVTSDLWTVVRGPPP